MNKDIRVPMREAWQMNLRALGVFAKRCPAVLVSITLSALFAALTPYVTIFFSARLIGELAGGRDARLLGRWALLTLLTTAAVSLISAALQRWKNNMMILAECAHDQLIMEKQMSLDFVDADSQYVADLYSQIEQNAWFSGFGFMKVLYLFHDFITACFSVIGGVGLCVTLFTSAVPDSASPLAFLGHPLFAVAAVAAMVLAALGSAKCSGECNKYWGLYAPMARLGNRLCTYFLFNLPQERHRALDQRIYEQQRNVGAPRLKQDISFGPGSWIAQKAKGPMGLWAVLASDISVLVEGAVYLFVCLKACAGAFGVGEVTQYIGAATKLFTGISSMLYALEQSRSNGEFMRVQFEYLDIPNRMYQGSLTTEKRADRQYEVEFRDVSFRYPGTDAWALRHVNMKFKVGRRLAVVGKNGSGKTTFIKLLCRLYDPTEGEILLNGINIRKYRYDDYMGVFSVVFQDFRLLALELGQNVAGRREYDDSDVRTCLEKAGFGARLSEMPKGLSTMLYKDIDLEGVEVSGGEAQKIAIARALYKNAPFIILDEPTAALDPIAEAEIYAKFDEIADDRTAIYISHRLSSCKFCDEIAVFDSGAIVQQGTHDALLAEETGLYAALWNAQAQYYT